MKAAQRRAIAALAACLTGMCAEGVLIDDDRNTPVELNVNSADKGFEIRDKHSNVIITVEQNLLKWVLYDQRTARYIDLESCGNNFRGYDYESAQYFTLNPLPDKIRIYDYETDDYHYFHYQR